MFLWRNIKGCFTSLFLEMTKGTKKGQISYPKSNLKIAEKSSKIAQWQWSLTLRFILLHDPQNVALVLQIRLILLVWVSKNIWKNKSSTKNCKLKNIELFSIIFTEYQPSGAGGTRSPPATPHRLQRRTSCQWAPKWPTGSGKVSTPRFWGAPVNFR